MVIETKTKTRYLNEKYSFHILLAVVQCYAEQITNADKKNYSFFF